MINVIFFIIVNLITNIYIYTGNIIRYRPHKIRTISPRGVHRRNKQDVRVFHGRKVKYNVLFDDPVRFDCCKHNVCKGVRKNEIVLYEPPKKRVDVNMLHFDRPCLCGSYLHRSTRSLYCLLNTQYLDD